MKADNPICYVVDGVLYLLLFGLLVAVLILLSVAAMLQCAVQLGVFLPIVCVLLAFGALRLVCGAPCLPPHERGLIWKPVLDVPEADGTDMIRWP